MKLAVRGQDFADVEVFLSAVREADLMVVKGAGVFTDAFSENALGVLATLEMAISRRIPTAMFGQGFGPIAMGELRRHAAEVLPSVNLIAVRERLRSPPLLASLGVNLERVVVTGDELPSSWRSRSDRGRHNWARWGSAGSASTFASRRTRASIGTISRRCGRHFGRHPVRTRRNSCRFRSRIRGRWTRTSCAKCAGTAAGDSDGGASVNTPERAIHCISKCRVVLTGSYHAGVFALAQGIPTVALARSQYYVDKLSGLADQFGDGCEVVRLEPTFSASRLAAAIGAAWDNAGATAGHAARPRVRTGRPRAGGYERLKTMVPSP